jgi:signal transduction histidine kinase
MTRRRWGLAVLAVAALAYALGGEWTSIRHGVTENHFLDAMVGLAFFAAGIVALDRRPGNRIGPLMVAYAITWFFGNWGNLAVPILPTLGWLGSRGGIGTPLLAHIALAYPSGRLRTTFERVVLGALYATSLATSIIFVLTWDPRAFGCLGCPWTPAVFSSEWALDAALWISDRSGIVFVPLFLAAIVLRWRRASRAERKDLAPLWLAASMLAIVYLIGAVTYSGIDDPFAYLLWEIRAVVQIGVPIVFLWGLLSTRLARSAVGDLVVELEHPLSADDLRAALAKTLADPSLEVAYAIEEDGRWVDADGRPVALPRPEGGRAPRATTAIESDGVPIAALIHDPALEPGLVRAVGAAGGMAIANERLRAEVRAQLEEVRTSRQRIVEAGDRERRRVERNLHDGAQQRLVTLSLSLAMLRDRVAHDHDTGQAVAEIGEDLRQAIAELRELARGIHPAILSEDGLEAAVRSLAERSMVPVRIHAELDGRLSEAIEATAYFVVSESLTNISKYANATGAEIRLRQGDGRLTISVNDDGVGGAEPSRGSGLLGLRDRVAALGGTLEISSPPGGGTRVVADIPFDD